MPLFSSPPSHRAQRASLSPPPLRHKEASGVERVLLLKTQGQQNIFPSLAWGGCEEGLTTPLPHSSSSAPSSMNKLRSQSLKFLPTVIANVVFRPFKLSRTRKRVLLRLYLLVLTDKEEKPKVPSCSTFTYLVLVARTVDSR